jgi:hypothetical protein
VAADAYALLENGVKTGPLENIKLQAAKFTGMGITEDNDQIILEQMLGKIKADFMKATSGAAVSEAEVKRLSKFLPDFSDQEEVIKSKLNTLSQEMSRQKAGLLASLGASANNEALDFRTQVIRAGYDYDAMKADGLSDEQIKNSI